MTTPNQVQFLDVLARQVGLQHLLLTPQGNLLERVLVGTFDGYLSILRVERDREKIPYYLLIIRCQPIQNQKALQKELSKALPHIPFIRNRNLRYSPLAHAELITLGCYFDSGQQFSDEIQHYLETVTGILKKHSPPTSPDLCEGKDCPDRAAGNTRLVLVNKFPIRLCSACIAAHPQQVAERECAYLASPSGLRKGIIAALLTSLVTGLVVAVMMNLGEYMAIFSMFVPILAFTALDNFIERAELKRTIPLWVVAAASITFISPVGTYLALAWRIWQSPELLQLSNILLYPAGQLGIEWKLMYFVAPWSLIIVLFLQQKIWSRSREQLQQKHHPQFVVVEEESLKTTP